MQRRRDNIYAKWRREADEEAAERSEMTELFAYPQPRYLRLARSAEPTATEPPLTESELPDDDLSVFEGAPVVLPENPSQHLRDQLAIPAIERLSRGRKAPDDQPSPGRTLSAAVWKEFMYHQTCLANEKRRRDWECHHPPLTRTVDGPVFDRLFESSRADRYEAPETPDEGGAPNMFGPASRRIVAEMGERPSVVREQRRVRNPETAQDTRSLTFIEESRAICNRKDPPLRPFLQRARRDWDFKDVIDDYRNSEAQKKDRESYYERLDE
jgi:hypothetical protein